MVAKLQNFHLAKGKRWKILFFIGAY